MLFKTKEKLLEYAELTASINFASVQATIRFVETNHIIPFTGQELYSSLNTNYTAAADESTLSASDKNLLDQCRLVIGPMVCYYYIAKAEIKVGDAGALRNETNSQKTAFQNQVLNYREQNLREAEMAIEQLLQFLDANKTSYPAWQTSSAFTSYKSLFIKSGGEFAQLFPSQSPYRNYWAMRSKMLDVEENDIRTLVGDTIYNNLKAKDQAVVTTFTDNENELIKKLKRVSAYLTVAFSIPFLNVRIDTNGITVMSPSGRAQNDELAKRGSAADPALNLIIEKCQDSARAWSNNVVKYLDEHASDFDGWPLTTQNITCNPEIGSIEEQVSDGGIREHHSRSKGSFGLL
ncbi:MAG TPA: DUF6712 family protein [Chitinophagaceae bacterium]|nr:DUF6712 family protein [Chitinophagaceae bacterium]